LVFMPPNVILHFSSFDEVLTLPTSFYMWMISY
jgi:hypothetical protein